MRNMSTTENLHTNNPDVLLVKPDIERDAALGVQWLEGELGRATLTSMGVSETDNKPTTLEDERERVRDFIEGQDQLNWMIEYQGKIVGSVWADLKQVGNVPAPAIHIMIGNPNVRGKGIGTASISAVIEHLRQSNTTTVYSRYLLENEGSKHLLSSLGFGNLGEPYVDNDGLTFQNVSLELSEAAHE